MMQNYLDAMSLCKWFGYPDFFITVTCNPKWPEIKRFLANTTLNPEDRPDILSRLFKIKLDSLIKDLKKKRLLGSVQAVVYTVEFQKRGLPHAHICLFMHSDNKLPTVEHIDRVISAEIPNKDDDPELYSLVSEFMMHGPCGSDNPKCPCMSENKCSKNFPKPFLENTSIDSNGYPIYRRRNDGSFIEKSGIKLDNRSVVPYHKTLLKRYQAHINVDWCNQAVSIKYLFKYINKGPDRATVEVAQNNNGGDNDDAPVDEIKNFYDCRYLSACEASWPLSLNDDQLKNLTLYEIEKIQLQNSSSLKDFVGMPYPDHDLVSSSNNRLITEELDFDMNSLQKESHQLLDSLTIEQRSIFDEIMTAVKQKKRRCVFCLWLWRYQTFLWKTLSASIRSKGNIVLNVASSGIVSLLLTGGRTTYSRFIIPLNLTKDSFCSFASDSDVAELLKKTSLIIWDKAPMIHKHAFEALDRSLKDILSCDFRGNSKLPFGGKTIVFGGDFRQILPVVPNGSMQDIVNASLSSSYIWSSCKVLTLTKNMRLSVLASDIQETATFAKWILDIGEGKVGGLNDGKAIIDIPTDLLIVDSVDPIGSLIGFVYPSIVENTKNSIYFQERAILASKNEVVQEINERLLKLFPGDPQEYLSSDSLSYVDFVHDEVDETLYSPDVLNGLRHLGMPIHKLVLKVVVPVMLLRNIDQKCELCNGTRLQVIALGKRVIEAEIISGSNIGNRTFIPRMFLTPSDKRIPFIFQRRQFPLAVCFAMTINKSQGQSLSRVGLFLRQPVFTHGQLYVALSRVKSKARLKILILDKDGKLTNTTSNVVFKEVFGNFKF
ncbi:uncharacterized protein LOC122197560 [Lactuca sativa]|uniref:uncharacterized protein LOC122197560 n=1 Tax=Lactuca sativa TaxID=4236 RepID=UPI001C687E25|nr:uncharacterized protein LOC122197560 [Lactuca sativa]